MLTADKPTSKEEELSMQNKKSLGPGNLLAAGAGNKWQIENPPLHHGVRGLIMAHKCQFHRLLFNLNIRVKKNITLW